MPTGKLNPFYLDSVTASRLIGISEANYWIPAFIAFNKAPEKPSYQDGNRKQ